MYKPEKKGLFDITQPTHTYYTQTHTHTYVDRSLLLFKETFA